MAEKTIPLSIVLRTVDKATAGINAVNKRLDELQKPTKDFGKALSDLAEKSGMNRVGDAFSRVGGAVTDLIGKVAMAAGVIGGLVGTAVAGVLSLVDHFDKLGDTAEKLGTSADFLAAFRYAAERAGAPIEGIDEALQALVTNMGAAKSGAGKMLKFLEEHVGHVFAQQIAHAHSLEEALGLLAAAEAKLPDEARRSKLAMVTLGNAALAPLLHRGAQGVQELLTEFHGLAGGLGDATEAAGKTDDALKNMHASAEGVKAALVTGLAPALTIVIDKLTSWFVGHREDVARWADQIGKELPSAVEKAVVWISKAYDRVMTFVDGIGGWKVAVEGVVAVMVGPLALAIAGLGVALLATPFGQVLLALSPIVAMVAKLVSETEAFRDLAESLGFSPKKKTPEQTFASDMDAMMEDGRRTAKAEAAGHAAFQNSPAKQAADLWQDQSDAFLAIPESVDPRDAARRKRMAALTAQIDQFSAQHPGPQEVKIKVDFANAPKGMRAQVAAAGGTYVDMTTGYQGTGL